MLYPGDALGAELSRRYRAVTGRPLVYVIGTMWDGGNVAHYAPEQPRVLIDGNPGARAVDRSRRPARERRGRGVDRRRIRTCMPRDTAPSPSDAEVQPPFTLPFRLGERHRHGRLGDPAAAAGGG